MSKTTFLAIHLLVGSMGLIGALVCTANLYERHQTGSTYPKDLLWAIPLTTAGASGLIALPQQNHQRRRRLPKGNKWQE